MPDIVHSSLIPSKTLGFTHRVGEPAFKYLFQGTASTPTNYLFALARQETFYSPIHKHNFEQIRYAHRGSFSISPTLTMEQGEVCYHPEGVPYGPQRDEGGEERVLLLLQFGGVSGSGYIEYERLLKTQKGMVESGKGQFEGGRLWKTGEKEGGGEGIDGFQSVVSRWGRRGFPTKPPHETIADSPVLWWEEVHGREMVYPEPRYEAPVLMKPVNFGWKEIESGVWMRHLGAFTERATRVEMLLIEETEYKIKGEHALQLGFVTRGAGTLDGEAMKYEDAFRLGEGEGAVIKADEMLEFFRIVVPRFEWDNEDAPR